MSYRHAVVTGASSGIGRALAKELAATGVTVYAVARREPELLSLAAESAPGKIVPTPFDIGDTDEWVEKLRALDREVGGLDLVVANAGASPAHDAVPYAWETLRGPCHTNFLGAVATLSALLPDMIARKRGHLVGVSSLASFGPLPKSECYVAPKAGLSAFIGCLQMDTQGTGVSVTVVHPGFVATPHVSSSPHPTPQRVSVEYAGKLLCERLPKRPSRIDFPQPFAFFARLFGALPSWLRAPLLRLAR
jgi:NADP-dependent 3-hydroxy acid dehydrogenase YdfG